MKQVLIDRYGPPEEVARCADVPDVGSPDAGEAVFDVIAGAASLRVWQVTSSCAPPDRAAPASAAPDTLCVGYAPVGVLSSRRSRSG
jgi:hypothetical protein